MIAETRLEMIAQAVKRPEVIKQRALVMFDLIRQADYGRDWMSDEHRHHLDRLEFLRGDNYCVARDKPGWVQWICRHFQTNPIVSVELSTVFQDDLGRPTVRYKLMQKDGTILQDDLPFVWKPDPGRWEGCGGLDWHLGRGGLASRASQPRRNADNESDRYMGEGFRSADRGGVPFGGGIRRRGQSTLADQPKQPSPPPQPPALPQPSP